MAFFRYYRKLSGICAAECSVLQMEYCVRRTIIIYHSISNDVFFSFELFRKLILFEIRLVSFHNHLSFRFDS